MSAFAPELFLIAAGLLFGGGGYLLLRHEGRKLDRRWGKRD